MPCCLLERGGGGEREGQANHVVPYRNGVGKKMIESCMLKDWGGGGGSKYPPL